jgi:adenylylsulfate kinase
MSEQRGFTLWFTGLSGSGKTALAKRLEPILRERGIKVERLDALAKRIATRTSSA